MKERERKKEGKLISRIYQNISIMGEKMLDNQSQRFLKKKILSMQPVLYIHTWVCAHTQTYTVKKVNNNLKIYLFISNFKIAN